MEKAVDIVNMLGGLGNQMFQYAFWCSLHSRYPDREQYINLTYFQAFASHNGYELDRVFGIKKSVEFHFPFPEWLDHLSPDQVEWIHEKASSFYQLIEDTTFPVRVFWGYWQTELYFKHIEKEIRDVFRFQENLLNNKTKEVALEMQQCHSVSIHIRRQDYLLAHHFETFGHICTPRYYRAAWNMLCQQVSSDQLFIYFFSDDPEWLKANITYENSLIVDWNQGLDSWQDMYLMSVCRYHILANSSFSWWGAWLDEKVDKIVIAPGVWFNNKLAPDILPEKWQSPYYMEKRWIDIVQKNVTSIPGKGLFHGQMGLIIFFFLYASVKDSSYEQTAERLLDSLVESITVDMADDYADGLAGIGTAIEFLLQNGFVQGDANEILEKIDGRLTRSVMHFSGKNLSLSTGLCGWLRYFRFRLHIPQTVTNRYQKLLNKQMLLHGLCYLEDFDNQYPISDEVVSELGRMGKIGLFIKRVERILRIFFQDSESEYTTLLEKAENVNEERINSLTMDRSLGLLGVAGKELKLLSIESSLPWTELI